MKILLLFIGLYFGFDAVSGHGSMYIPSPWHATSDCDKSMDPKNCEFGLVVPETEDYKCKMTARGQWPGGPGGCSRNAGFTFWFTNYTTVEEFNIPKEMYDKWSGRQSYAGKNPWNSPGAAPVQGNGCGVNGGNQFGCDGEDFVRGRCCMAKEGTTGCGAYVGGKPALEHYKDGLFGKKPRVTRWKRGEPAEVYWSSGVGHRGGYAYRLCKVYKGQYWKVTEECFQKGHLNFYGKTAWMYDRPLDGNYSEDGWQAVDLVSTTEGTTPEGSQWAKINLPRNLKWGDYWGFKDLVDVPKNLARGDYVLSFRWDCQTTPQVWNACANIKIV